MCTHPSHAQMKGFWSVIKPGEDQKDFKKKKTTVFTTSVSTAEVKEEERAQSRCHVGGEGSRTVSLLISPGKAGEPYGDSHLTAQVHPPSFQ